METDITTINISNLKQVDKLVEKNRIMSVSKHLNSILLAPQFNNGNKYVTFKWKYMKRSFLYAKKPIYLDFGEGYLLLIKRIYPEGTGWGNLVSAEDLQ